jgi:hypothetical protein
MDYCSGDVLRINPLPHTREEIFNEYHENVEDWLYAHEKELSIRMKDYSYMVVNDSRDYRSIHI